MTRKQNFGSVAAIGGLTAAVALLACLPAAKADELSDLKANQQLLQQRIEQLAQGGPPSRLGAPGMAGRSVYGTAPVPGAALVGGSFPRSFLIPGTDTSIRVGGFADLTMDYYLQNGPANGAQSTTVSENGNLLSMPLDVHGQAVPVVGAGKFPGKGNFAPSVQTGHSRGNGVFLMSARESRLNAETRTPTAYGEARTFIEFDFAGLAVTNNTHVSNSLLPRLRYAYGTLGGFLAGQANSNFSDPDANPETLDFGGPVGEAGVVRIPQIRYTYAGPWGSAWSASLETPETDVLTPAGQVQSDTIGAITPNSPTVGGFCVANGQTVSAGACPLGSNITKSSAPDITFASYWSQPWGHVDFKGVVRPTLQVNDGKYVDRKFVGYGFGIGSSVNPGWLGWAKDNFQWQFTVGNGLGRYMNESTDASLVTNYTNTPQSAAEANTVLVKPATRRRRHRRVPALVAAEPALERGLRLHPARLLLAAAGAGGIDRCQQGADDRARQPDLEPGRVHRHRHRIFLGPPPGRGQPLGHPAGADQQVPHQVLTTTTTFDLSGPPGSPAGLFFSSSARAGPHPGPPPWPRGREGPASAGGWGPARARVHGDGPQSEAGRHLAHHRSQPGQRRLVAVVAVPQRHHLERRRRVGRLEQLEPIGAGKGGREAARHRRGDIRLADHGQRREEMRGGQADDAAQPARRQRALQQRRPRCARPAVRGRGRRHSRRPHARPRRSRK